MGERCIRIAEVEGSNPLPSTKLREAERLRAWMAEGKVRNWKYIKK